MTVEMRDHTQGQPVIPERLHGPLAELTRPPTGPITPGNTNKGGHYTPLMKDTGGQRGASWTPPEEKMIDPNPPTPHPSIITSNFSSHQCPPEPSRHASQSAPSTTCVSLGCVTQGGPAEVGKGRGLNGAFIESVNVAQRGPTGGRRQQQESC